MTITTSDYYLIASLYMAYISAAYAGGFQFQSLMYILVVLLTGAYANADTWLLYTVAHLLAIGANAFLRVSHKQ